MEQVCRQARLGLNHLVGMEEGTQRVLVGGKRLSESVVGRYMFKFDSYSSDLKR
jgi:hypothetical protein